MIPLGDKMTVGVGRRDFIALLGGMTFAWPLEVRAERPAAPIIGFLHAGSADAFIWATAAFQRGLHETGYVEGQNVVIEYRWAEKHYERLPSLAADLIHQNVAVLAAAPAAAAFAAKTITATIPIVFELGVDPVASGLVASLNRPGGNATGVVNLSVAVTAKSIEMMHEVVPGAKVIAFLVNPDNSVVTAAEKDGAQAAQSSLGVQIQFLEARGVGDLYAAFVKVAEMHAGALVISSDPSFVSQYGAIATLAEQFGVPTSLPVHEFVRAGGLMSYGSDFADAYHLQGVYAGRILKGEKPANLPVQQATKVALAINLKTAKVLGLTLPLALLGRADEVIE
jgi:putative tryptophan/tyrosine transport system substrate-binding protein